MTTTTTDKPQLPYTLTREDFEAIAAHCYRIVSKEVAKGREAAQVVLLGRCRDGVPRIQQAVHTPLRDWQDKEAVTLLMTLAVADPEIDFALHVTETWILDLPDDGSAEIPTGSIAKHPKRREAVIFNIMSKDCQIVVINPLRRKPNRLERGTIDFDIQLKGRMVRETPPKN
jgi:hypothetical protein